MRSQPLYNTMNTTIPDSILIFESLPSQFVHSGIAREAQIRGWTSDPNAQHPQEANYCMLVIHLYTYSFSAGSLKVFGQVARK